MSTNRKKGFLDFLKVDVVIFLCKSEILPWDLSLRMFYSCIFKQFGFLSYLCTPLIVVDIYFYYEGSRSVFSF